MTEHISLIEQERRKEKEEAKKKAPRGKRTLNLIADFNREGYAAEWHFKVSKAFKDELDIKYLQRMEPVLDENGNVIKVPFKDKKGKVKLKKDGTPRMRRKTKPVMKWTQGKEYCFDVGHIIHGPNLLCQVERALPNSLNGDSEFKKGSVTFVLYERDLSGKLQKIGLYHLTQNEFVEYLKTGVLKEGSEDLKA